MITSLAIKNYALIEDIRVDFNAGLTIITGETGAGKSILLGALGLVLGKRADSKVMRDTDKKCVIEAEFSISDYHLEPLFEANDLDHEAFSILRREILPNGKSRAFVNDTPVTLQQMQALGSRLIDVHSQNDTQTLATESYQMEVVDALANHGDLLTKYANELTSYKELLQRLDALKTEKDQSAKDLDYHTFLYTELKEARLAAMDQEELEATYERLNNAEEILETLSRIDRLLTEEQSGARAVLSEVRTFMSKIRRFSSEYDALWERLNSVWIELEDISAEIEGSTENLEANPNELVQVNDSLQKLYSLQKKHAASTVEELIAIETDLEEKLEMSSNIEERILAIEKEKDSAKASLLELALQLNTNRNKAIPVLTSTLETFLKELGLPNAKFQMELQPLEEFRKNGNASLELLFTANKGMALGPLQKVASGGEMSRIMLAVKAVLNRYKKLPTLIFDEIDTGVSGEIAHKMAEIMNAMSENMQVLSITHLPQIAAKGDYHKKVFKEEGGNATKTQIKELSPEERIIEIAQMIGGSSVSDSAIAHAKQLLN